MFSDIFNIERLFTFFYKFQNNFKILSLQHFGNFRNPCNIDIATFGLFLKFLATFFCNIFVAKIVVLQHFLMLQEKLSMLQKKKPMPAPLIKVGPKVSAGGGGC